MSESGTIELSEHIAQPPARVWEALTKPEIVAKWWAQGDVQPVVGHRFTLDMGPFGQQQCQVLAVEPEQLFSYTFGEGMLNTVITWSLTAEDEGTKLDFAHAGFDLDTPMGQQAFGGMAGGWPQILAKISTAIAE